MIDGLPDPEMASAWWQSARGADLEAGAPGIWSYFDLVRKTKSSTPSVAKWARRRLAALVPPFPVDSLLELIEDGDPTLAAWAAIHLSVAASQGFLDRSEALRHLLPRLRSSRGARGIAFAQALGRLGGEEALEALIQKMKKCSSGTDLKIALLGELGQLPEARSLLLEELQKVATPEKLWPIARNLLPASSPEALIPISQKCQALGLSPFSEAALLTMAFPAGGNGFVFELDSLLGPDWSSLGGRFIDSLNLYFEVVRVPDFPVRRLAKSLRAGKIEELLEQLIESVGHGQSPANSLSPETSLSEAWPEGHAADRHCHALLEHWLPLARKADPKKRATISMARYGIGAVLAFQARRVVRRALVPSASATDLVNSVAAMGASLPPGLMERWLTAGQEFADGIQAILKEGVTSQAGNWCALIVARRRWESMAEALLLCLDSWPGPIGRHTMLLAALGILGEATVAAAERLYMSGELESPEIGFIAATVTGTNAAAAFIKKAREFEDLDPVAYTALLAQIAPEDALLDIAPELADPSPALAKALLPSIELLTKLGDFSHKLLRRTRRQAKGKRKGRK